MYTIFNFAARSARKVLYCDFDIYLLLPPPPPNPKNGSTPLPMVSNVNHANCVLYMRSMHGWHYIEDPKF